MFNKKKPVFKKGNAYYAIFGKKKVVKITESEYKAAGGK